MPSFQIQTSLKMCHHLSSCPDVLLDDQVLDLDSALVATLPIGLPMGGGAAEFRGVLLSSAWDGATCNVWESRANFDFFHILASRVGGVVNAVVSTYNLG